MISELHSAVISCYWSHPLAPSWGIIRNFSASSQTLNYIFHYYSYLLLLFLQIFKTWISLEYLWLLNYQFSFLTPEKKSWQKTIAISFMTHLNNRLPFTPTSLLVQITMSIVEKLVSEGRGGSTGHSLLVQAVSQSEVLITQLNFQLNSVSNEWTKVTSASS